MFGSDPLSAIPFSSVPQTAAAAPATPYSRVNVLIRSRLLYSPLLSGFRFCLLVTILAI